MSGALNKLIEAVEAGLPSPTNWRNFAALPEGGPDNPAPILAHRAYYGSLDAAKALHEALLPGWVVRLTHRDASVPHVHVFKMRMVEEDPPQGANSAGFKGHDPARSWLLAILRAYSSQQEPTP